MTSILDPVTSTLSVAGYRFGWQVVRRMPEFVAYRLFDRLADVASVRNAKGVRRLRSNYLKIHPELSTRAMDRLVREGMRSYLRYYCDAFRLPDKTPEDLASIVEATGDEPIRATLKSGRGVAVFVPHMGNFDIGGAWSTTHLWPVTTVAERLKPEEVFQDFLRFRTELGMTIVPLTGGPKPFAAMRDALSVGGFVALASDRDLTSSGIEVDLCGHRARVAKGPAALALATGSALHAAAVWYDDAPAGRGVAGKIVRIEFSPDLTAEPILTGDPVTVLTQRCADFVGEHIAAHTSDWHMLQRVFVDDLDPTRAPASQAEQR